MARSATSATPVVTVTLLFPGFGSVLVDDTVSVSVMAVPDATLLFTVTTSVKGPAVAPLARFVPSVQVRVASVQVHPAGPVNETAVTFGEIVSTNFGVGAFADPPLVTVWV